MNPTASTTYMLVSVTGSDGCIRTSGFTVGSANVIVVNPAVIQTQPSDVALCSGSNAQFSVTASGTGLTYQWQVSTNGGTSWTNLSDNTVYSGTQTALVNLTNPGLTYSGYRYRVLINN